MNVYWAGVLGGLLVIIGGTAALGWMSSAKAERSAAARIEAEVLQGKPRTSFDPKALSQQEERIRLEEMQRHKVSVGLWITVEVVILFFGLLIYLLVGNPPTKWLAVAQAAYREAIRQPLFWFLLVFALFLMILAVFLPYFTFKPEDELKMIKSLELDTILLATLILTVLTASTTISEEIEGRTAITLLSKPMSRRQYLLGKFVGILCAALLMAGILSLFMGWTVNYRTDVDRLERPGDPREIQAMQDALSAFPSFMVQTLRYILLIFAEVQALAPGIVLNLCQVMVLTAVAVALATRLPMAVNLVVCLTMFFVGRLTHILEAQSQDNPLVKFVAQLFSTLLPGFNYFDVGPAIVNEVEVPWTGYVFQAGLHGLIYTVIALLFGLILFEDRDVA